MDSGDYAEMQILLWALVLPLGEEEEMAHAEAAFANYRWVVDALSSRLAWKMEAPQSWMSGLFFFYLSKKRMEQQTGCSRGPQYFSQM